MEGSGKSGKPRSGRTIMLAVVAVVAILAIAAAAVLLLGQPGPDDDGANGGDDNGDDIGDGAAVLPFDMKDGDFIEYSVSSSAGGLNGTMRMTFSNITDEGYTVNMTMTFDGMAFSTEWNAGINDTIGSSHDEQGEPAGFGEEIGQETIETEFGPRQVTHYRNATDDGTVTDYYIGQDMPILYRTVTTDEASGTTTIELNDTNIPEIRDANR